MMIEKADEELTITYRYAMYMAECLFHDYRKGYVKEDNERRRQKKF